MGSVVGASIVTKIFPEEQYYCRKSCKAFEGKVATMPSLPKRTIILTICRVMNYFIAFLSTIFLVRILDVHAYGQYREFLLYAMLLANFISLAIPRNLLYFIPRAPHDAAKYVTHTALLTLTSWLIGAGFIFLARGFILARTSYDFIVPLIIFIFFFLNLDFLESYWLAKKRTDYVLYYSVLRVVLGVVVIVGAAYYYRDVKMVIKAMIIFETIKFAFCLYFLTNRKLLIYRLDWQIVREQLIYTIPLGVAGIIYYFNQQLGRLFISTKLGVEALAIFAIGSTQVPIIKIVRGAISDVIFPEMAQKNVQDPLQGLRLWQRANIVYCFLVFPTFVVLFWYAEIIIRTVFTSQYLVAVPVFRVCLLLLLRQCFEMGSPLRAMNLNKYFIVGNIIFLGLNVTLLLILFKYAGLVGPAIAFVLADLGLSIYLVSKILKAYQIRISQLFFWREISKIILACTVGLPALLLGRFIHINDVAQALVCSGVYAVVYYLFVRYYKIEEVELMVARVSKKLVVLFSSH